MERIAEEYNRERASSSEVDLAALSREIASYNLRAEHKYWELERRLSKGNQWEALKATAERMARSLKTTLTMCMLGVAVAQGAQTSDQAEPPKSAQPSGMPLSHSISLESNLRRIAAPPASEIIKPIVVNLDATVATSTGTWNVVIRHNADAEQFRAQLKQVGVDVLAASGRAVAGESRGEIARLTSLMKVAQSPGGIATLSEAELKEIADVTNAMGSQIDGLEDQYEQLTEVLGELQMAAMSVSQANDGTDSAAFHEFIKLARAIGIDLSYEPYQPTIGQQIIR